jgi:hypothetical protein
MGDISIRQLVVSVSPLPLCCNETRFNQTRKMFACRLWADMGNYCQFSRWHGAAAHQHEEHGGPCGLGEEFGICECIAHKDSMQVLFRRHSGPRRTIFTGQKHPIGRAGEDGKMKSESTPSSSIPGYDYGTPQSAISSVSESELLELEQTAGWSSADADVLVRHGDAFRAKAESMVDSWRAVIGSQLHLAMNQSATLAARPAFADS